MANYVEMILFVVGIIPAAGDIRDTGFRCHRGTGNCLRGSVAGIGGD